VKEAKISREIQTFLRTLGFAVYSTEQGYRKDRGGTRQTPGIPDLIVIGHGRFLFAEVKAPGGKLRASQKEFCVECERNGVPWALWYDVRDTWDWCVAIGVVEEVG